MFDAALPYEEPTLVTILILSSFLLVLNVLGAALDHVVYCGLVGQVLVGMAWGTPGAKILSRSFEEVATQLGFLGLICIVFEGGLSTSAKAVRSSLVLSISVALTGILLPIAFSFSLIGLSNASHLQAFAAGSALCSTSLGTTFSLLKTTGLTRSRLGTVLTTAAMLDDVVGLIMVQVIANLGSGGTSVPATTIVRPIFVSFGFAVVFPIACRFLVPPIVQRTRGTKAFSRVAEYPVPLSFLLSTAFLVGLVTAANSAGTSILFAAYLAGAIISWIDETIMEANAAQQRHAETIRAESHGEDETNNKTSTIPVDLYPAADEPSEVATSTVKTNQNLPMRDARVSHELTPPPEANDEDQNEIPPTVAASIPGSSEGQRRSEHMYHEYYSSAVERVLKPFFFASIGFSIPITKMFRGAVVWRGFLYALLMAVGKLFCGVWLIRFATPASTSQPSPSRDGSSREKNKNKGGGNAPRPSLPRPRSLYPASLLGCAMVARGEIGFLISAIAASNGIFTAKEKESAGGSNDVGLASDVYLIVTWAILLCTVVGPLALGFLAKRVKRLQEERRQTGMHGREDPLGAWGV